MDICHLWAVKFDSCNCSGPVENRLPGGTCTDPLPTLHCRDVGSCAEKFEQNTPKDFGFPGCKLLQKPCTGSFCFLQALFILFLKIETSVLTRKICYLLFLDKLPPKIPTLFLLYWRGQEIIYKSFISGLMAAS